MSRVTSRLKLAASWLFCYVYIRLLWMWIFTEQRVQAKFFFLSFVTLSWSIYFSKLFFSSQFSACCHFLNTETRFQSQGSPCAICSVKMVLGQVCVQALCCSLVRRCPLLHMCIIRINSGLITGPIPQRYSLYPTLNDRWLLIYQFYLILHIGLPLPF